MPPWFLNHIPHIANYHWSPTIPKFYWAVKSQEQRILHICRELCRLFAFSDFLVDSINDAYDVINKLSRTIIHGTKPIDVEQDFDTNTATISLDQQDILDNGLIGSELDKKLEVPDIVETTYIDVENDTANRKVTIGLNEDAVLADGKIHDELDKKLEAHNIKAGQHVSVAANGNDVTINSQDVTASAPIVATTTAMRTDISVDETELAENLLEDGAIKDKLDEVDTELDKKLNTTDLATLRSHSTDLVVPVHYHTPSGASADFLNLGQPSDTHTRLGVTLRSTNSYLLNDNGALAVDDDALVESGAVKDELDNRPSFSQFEGIAPIVLNKVANGNIRIQLYESYNIERILSFVHDRTQHTTFISFHTDILLTQPEMKAAFAKKLEATNIIAGENITLDTDGNDITINSEGGAGVQNISGLAPIIVEQDADTHDAEISLDQRDIINNGLIGEELYMRLRRDKLKAGNNISIEYNDSSEEYYINANIPSTSRVVRHTITGEDTGDSAIIGGGYALSPITLDSDEWVTAMGYTTGGAVRVVHMPEVSYEYVNFGVRVHLWAVEDELALGDTIWWVIQKGAQRALSSTTDIDDTSRVVSPLGK